MSRNDSRYAVPRNNGDDSLAWRIAVTAAFAIVGVAIAIWLSGCSRGDIQISPVIQGQSVPHSGYLFSINNWHDVNEPARHTGLIGNIKGLDPNSLVGGDSTD